MSEKVLVTPAELSAFIKTEPVVIIDTRDPATYAAGHLPNCCSSPPTVRWTWPFGNIP